MEKLKTFFILCKRQHLYLIADADANANADTEMPIPRFPNGRLYSYLRDTKETA